MGRLIAVAVATAALVAGVLAVAPTEDDQPVDPSHPRARQAISVAREVVPGSVVDVSRDRDNGKWEVTLRQAGEDYEVELDPDDLSLLRVDYD